MVLRGVAEPTAFAFCHGILALLRTACSPLRATAFVLPSSAFCLFDRSPNVCDVLLCLTAIQNVCLQNNLVLIINTCVRVQSVRTSWLTL